MRSVLCLIAVSIVNACDEHHCWCRFENCQKYIYIVGRKKVHSYIGVIFIMDVMCISQLYAYTFNSRPFSIPIEKYKSILRTRFISWAWKVISYKQITKKKFAWNVIFYVFFWGLYFACGAKTKQQKSSLLTFRYARWKENESNYGASSFPCFASRFLCHIKGNAVQ